VNGVVVWHKKTLGMWREILVMCWWSFFVSYNPLVEGSRGFEYVCALIKRD